MNPLLGLWNLVRVVLILFCAAQLGVAAMATQQAVRFLDTFQPAGEQREAMAEAVEDARIAGVELDKKTGHTLLYVGFLFILALSPYARASRRFL